MSTSNIAESQSKASLYRSNLQKIFDGTLPSHGIAYPEDFVQNIRRQHNAHKDDERQRRERLRIALDELESKLPDSASDHFMMSKVNATPRNRQGLSKAEIVEAAITYISMLEGKLARTPETDNIEEKLSHQESCNSQTKMIT